MRLEFTLGERVSFHPKGREPLFGVVTRYNKKTVTVVSEQGQRWNVAPTLLRRVKDVKSSEHGRAKVVELHKK